MNKFMLTMIATSFCSIASAATPVAETGGAVASNLSPNVNGVCVEAPPSISSSHFVSAQDTQAYEVWTVARLTGQQNSPCGQKVGDLDMVLKKEIPLGSGNFEIVDTSNSPNSAEQVAGHGYGNYLNTIYSANGEFGSAMVSWANNIASFNLDVDGDTLQHSHPAGTYAYYNVEIPAGGQYEVVVNDLLHSDNSKYSPKLRVRLDKLPTFERRNNSCNKTGVNHVKSCALPGGVLPQKLYFMVHAKKAGINYTIAVKSVD